MLDFNDLLFETHEMLTNNKEVRQKYQNTYHHVLVDEYQDTTPLQVEILKLLINNGSKSSFWVCADDWQSIYSFTGASVGNILNFDKMFNSCKQFILDINYRSTPEILNCCQLLINHNCKKNDKVLQTQNPGGQKAVIIEATNEEDEAVQIVTEIKSLTEANGYQFKDIAVLYRANSLSRPIEDGLKQHQIPYHIENGASFYQRNEACLSGCCTQRYSTASISRMSPRTLVCIMVPAVSQVSHLQLRHRSISGRPSKRNAFPVQPQ